MGLKPSDVHWVAHTYIGVSGGYLGDFTYRSHREFYPGYCDLNIDPESLPGTTRERFMRILGAASAVDQAAILRGVARRFPVGSEASRTAAAHAALLKLVDRCVDGAAVSGVTLHVSAFAVQRALQDAELLIERHGPISALDRMHTALHGYMKALCASVPVEAPGDATIYGLFKVVLAHHPALNDERAHSAVTKQFLRALGSMMDGMNPARNWGSLAHANAQLLDKDDAMLVVNASRAILQYLTAKIPVVVTPP